MIKANISKENATQSIAAEGNVMELVNDVTVLISAIHTQFQNMDPATAWMFRVGLQAVVRDPNGPCWKAVDGHTGIIFPKAGQESDGGEED